jgi:hypothetical protein
MAVNIYKDVNMNDNDIIRVNALSAANARVTDGLTCSNFRVTGAMTASCAVTFQESGTYAFRFRSGGITPTTLMNIDTNNMYVECSHYTGMGTSLSLTAFASGAKSTIYLGNSTPGDGADIVWDSGQSAFIRPAGDGEGNLGTSSYHFRNCYLKGDLVFGVTGSGLVLSLPASGYTPAFSITGTVYGLYFNRDDTTIECHGGGNTEVFKMYVAGGSAGNFKGVSGPNLLWGNTVRGEFIVSGANHMITTSESGGGIYLDAGSYGLMVASNNSAFRAQAAVNAGIYFSTTGTAMVAVNDIGGAQNELFGAIATQPCLGIKEASATPTNLAGYGFLYTKSDNKLYFKSGDNVEHEVAYA